MYTQCPDCGTSFRVTAEVLKMAGGKVRCGGCGNAFNALAYLSETKPVAPVAPPTNEAVPELKPDLPADATDTPPAAISAEQSAALLKTLDQLAGDEVRIEDTGIEWRVLDATEEKVDEVLDDSPTPVDEFLTKTPTAVDAEEIFEDAGQPAPQTRVEELRFDDDTGLPDDFDLDDLPTPPPPPEPEPEPAPPPVSQQVDLAFGDPEEWGELLDEVDTSLAESTPTELVPELSEDMIPPPEPVAEEPPPDIDTQFGIQAEAMGIDISGIHELPEEPEKETSIDDDLIAAAFEKEKDVAAESPQADETPDEAPDQAPDEEHPAMAELAEPAIEMQAIDSGLEDLVAEGNSETVYDEIRVRMDDEPPLGETEHHVPEPTEEEKTVNMQIDAELMAIAIEDDDGFASTIVIEDKKKEDVEAGALELELADDAHEQASDLPFDEDAPGVETIVMEGDVIEAALDRQRAEAERSAKEPQNLSFMEAAKRTMRGTFAANDGEPKEGGRRFGMIAAIVLLAVLLVVQFVHQSRTALATVPAVNDVIAPLYRAVGAPITPDWDVAGWRFEKSVGTTNPLAFAEGDGGEVSIDELDPLSDIIAEGDEVLTIYSRVGNKSDGPLPYPLISVSLTDRFEETIGSIVLEPAEYLTGNLDPRVPVATGNTFNAVISIESPSPDATGFKLNVCYRQAGDLLRCAIEDFK